MAEDCLRLSVDVSAVPARAAGAGHYTIELVRALSARSDVDLVAVSRRDDAARWSEITGAGRVAAVAPAPRPLRLGWEQLRLSSLVGGLHRQVHHGPHYTMPERARLPVVVTVHDLSFFTEPGWHERSKVVLFRRAIRVAARRAAAVVCPSHVTAAELARWCPPVAPVFVAHHGVDAARFAPSPPPGEEDGPRLRNADPRLVAGRPLVVFVGTLEPRKDVPTLVRAFAQLRSRHPDAVLVLAGGRGWGADAVDRAVADTGSDDRVVRLGYVEDVLVPALLRAATVAAYPARYEGFGLPALEALACGAPVVTTEGTAMAEVTGDAATLVPAGDGAALADALDAELSGPPAAGATARRRRGLEIAAGYTWAASAARHLEAYRHAAATGRPGAPGRSADHPVG
ncbi:MAG: glycosyltransferase family 4 protein [Acidimicrobiales bacterium]|nr:glycosyltransferase family 4 protein [Acidimicrobiales bacterium]